MAESAAVDESREDRFAYLAKRHPCFSQGAHGRVGRLHLPVSPSCNIRCRFCTRGLDAAARRPGVAGRVVAPGEAVALVDKSLALCPELAVVGVAGPGDALATDHALEALAGVHRAHPKLLMCLSTNGLRLAERIGELVDAGVATVTVTVNSLDPAAQAGASLMNVIPLIPGLRAADLRAPTCDELKAARAAAERHLPVFRHCRQCRADALGVPGRGDDLAARLFGDNGPRAVGAETFSHG